MHPEKLWVYECKSEQSPEREPERPGYLGLWPEPPHHYYFFFDRCVDDWFPAWLDRQGEWTRGPVYRLDYQEWQQIGAKERHIGPFLIRLVPPGQPPPRVKRVLHLIPGLVFGTGLHPTTEGCLLLLGDLLERLRPETVVDLGTGTGILSLACAAMEVPRVLALECNPLALKEAARNVRAGGREAIISCIGANGLRVLRGDFDLLLMNLEGASLSKVLESGEWTEYPHVVLSGILETQWEDFSRWIPASFREGGRETVDDWLTVYLQRVES